MSKSKVVWLTNVDLLNKNPNQTGTWMHSMFNAIKGSQEFDICAIITFTSKKSFYSVSDEGTYYFYVPNREQRSNHYPTKTATDYVVNAILSLSPDIIHIWGMELNWGLIMGDARLAGIKKLLEIQGIKSIYSENQHFMACLGADDFRKMRSVLQRILPIRRLEFMQKNYRQWKSVEAEILSYIPHINTQSDWVRSIIPTMGISENMKMYNTGIILRDSFMSSTPWHLVHQRADKPVLFTTTSSLPYKGLHVTIKAFKLVLSKYPNAVLYIAGMDEWRPNLIKGGYNKYISELVNELNIRNSIVFLGNIGEKKLLEHMYKADVFVVSSFVETYCLALAEALATGVPSVVAFSAVLPELVKDGCSGLLYPPGDYYMCADRIIQYLDNRDFSYEVSECASSSYRRDHSTEAAINMQLSTYRDILKS